jgi:hypothetical protein
LEQRPRDRVPLNWATAQNSLGSAFWSMGERDDASRRGGGGFRLPIEAIGGTAQLSDPFF